MIGEAWQTGAAQLSAEQRPQLANDPLELLAVDGPSNQATGDGDASQWRPPDAAYRCPYAAREVAVKTKHRLWTTPAEHAALLHVLGGCPTQTRPDPTIPGSTVTAPHDGAVSPPHRHPGPGSTRDGPHSAAGWLLA